jgi:hypothetical protein
MTTSNLTNFLLSKGGIVLVDPAPVQRAIVLQYNAEMLTRSLRIQAATSPTEAPEKILLSISLTQLALSTWILV